MSVINDKARQLDELLNTAVQDDKEAGVFRCRRDIFTNEDLYELEMKHIFESNWVYLAHESQIPNNNDYYTTWIGRQPVVVTRDKTGELHAVINACAHKGAMLCRRKHGNKGSFTCPFHGWTFSNTGKLLKVKDEKTTEYPVQFNKHGSHDLRKVPRFQCCAAIPRISTTATGRCRWKTAATATTSAPCTGTTPRRWAAARKKAPRRWMRTAGASRSQACTASTTATSSCGPRR
jgi:nitrite reductase/ring-hydroxylating ferredoxin subunit